MIVDCDRCLVRGDACAECVITVLLGAPPGGLELDSADHRALDTLAAAGMVPRLQLVERPDDHARAQDERRASEAVVDVGRKRAEWWTSRVERVDRHVS